jgi:hypothetical protein
MTAPSLSRKSRSFVEEMGRDGYAVSLQEAISLRIWDVRIYQSGQHMPRSRDSTRTSLNTPYSSLGTSRLAMAFHTRS